MKNLAKQGVSYSVCLIFSSGAACVPRSEQHGESRVIIRDNNTGQRMTKISRTGAGKQGRSCYFGDKFNCWDKRK